VSQDPFPYMRWAKRHLQAAWGPSNLGMSGVPPPDAGAQEAWGQPPAFEVGAPRRALKQALAARYGIEPDGIHTTAGTSHANFIVYLALARGGRVAAEAPAYEALHRLTPAVGASLDLVQRDPRRDWRIDPASLAAAIHPDTDLLVVSDLHNPSGKRLHPDDLDLLIGAAERHDALLLVDEVYADFDPDRRPTAARRHPRVLATNSLTKVHGLGALRCGWILASPDVIRRIEAWDDLVHPEQPPAMLAAAAAYLPHAEERAAGIRAQAAQRSDQVDAWVANTPGVSWTRPDGGVTAFLRLGDVQAPGDGDRVSARLFEKHAVRIVPGSFFQSPDWLRLSYLLAEEDLAAALAALADVLAEPAP